MFDHTSPIPPPETFSVKCAVCGRTSPPRESLPFARTRALYDGWTYGVHGGGELWQCPECSRKAARELPREVDPDCEISDADPGL